MAGDSERNVTGAKPQASDRSNERVAPTDLAGLLIEAALAEGFVAAGVVDIDRVDLSRDVQSYDRWLERGYAGEMSYLARGRDRRADVRQVFPEARSMLCVAIPYPRVPAGARNFARGPQYARYLQGPDYHVELADRLERAMTRVSEQSATPLKWKVCVDTSAILERSWAAAAGIGWIGKNTMLIHPKHGSYLFLAEVLIDRATGRGPSPIPNYCGNCTRCLDACPVSAFDGPGVMNASKCISYLTLEKRGEWNLSEDARQAMGGWVAGCDICQEVCPFNVKPTRAELARDTERLAVRGESPSATALAEWLDLLRETEEQYRARVARSALKRVKPAQFRRNLALALDNSIAGLMDEGNLPAARQLARAARPELLRLLETESDPVARAEWARCLSRVAAACGDEVDRTE